MSLQLTILGCHSANPRTNAYPTAQFLEINNRFFLVDCGEGTQRQMRKHKVGFSKINHIFISHLHGDHFFGLIGLLSTYGILNRDKELHVFGPKGIRAILSMLLKHSVSHLNYPLSIHELSSDKSELIFEDEKVTVETIPLNHRIYTNGFLFREKEKARKLNIKAVQKFGIDKSQYNNIKAGKDIELENGQIISHLELTIPPPKPLSFAFCSDTAFKPDIIPQIKNVTLLYHESTFLKDRTDLAKKTKHSTAEEAAKIAKDANASKLILGHYSNRYPKIEDFKSEAERIFQNVFLAEAGKVFSTDS